MRGFAWISLVFATVGGCATTPGDGRFAFGIIGDTPYTKVQEREYQNVLKVLNATELAFVVHVGDFQFDARPYNQNPAIASMPCVEESYRAIYDSFQSVRHPFVLTPGDNDWTDCWPLQAVKVDPLQLLSGIRARFYPEGRSLGQRTIAVTNQSSDPAFGKFLENFTRVETFGWPDSHWVKIEVDPSDPQLFIVRPQIVPENRASHREK